MLRFRDSVDHFTRLKPVRFVFPRLPQGSAFGCILGHVISPSGSLNFKEPRPAGVARSCAQMSSYRQAPAANIQIAASHLPRARPAMLS